MIYWVSVYDWEESYHITVEGPEQPDWEAYCTALLPEAMRWVMDHPEHDAESLPAGTLRAVCDDSIQDAMIVLLKERGYTVVDVPDFAVPHVDKDYLNKYPGPLMKQVKKHNARVLEVNRELYRQQREAREGKR